MSRHGFDRRTVLRGLLGGSVVTVGLPALEIFLNPNGTAYAAGDGFPCRFGLFYWGNGMHPDRWIPSSEGEGDAWQLSEQLMPLARIKDQLTVVTGLDVKIPNMSPHGSGRAGMLTGKAPLNPSDGSTYAGPTIDRFLASRIGGSTRFRSIEFGAFPEGGNSYEGQNQLFPAESSPFALFERLFGAGFLEPGEEPVIDPSWALRRSVLDAISQDAERMKRKVGAADRQRLDQHLDGIRELELRLARLEDDPPDLAACFRPDAPLSELPPVDGRPQMRERNRILSELVAIATACDQTRVWSNWFSQAVSNILYPGINAGHHQLTHDEPGRQPQVHSVVLQIMECFADTVEAFRNIPEGDGTLLDHTVILGTSEVSEARLHSILDMPVLLSGSAGGRLKMNMHKRYGGLSTSRLGYTLLQTMGAAEPWGAGDNLGTEALSELQQ